MDKEHYLDLIPSFLDSKPRYKGVVDAILEIESTMFDCVDSMVPAFSLSTAVGNQLDIIGELVGVNRLMPFTFADGSSRELDDEEYRLMLRLKIAKNIWDGTNTDINAIYTEIFNYDTTVEYKDNQDMTVEYTIHGTFTTRDGIILGATGNLLVPAGVDVTLYVIGKTSTAEYSALCGMSGEEKIDRSSARTESTAEYSTLCSTIGTEYRDASAAT